MSQGVFGSDKEYDTDAAIALANSFVAKLRADTPFLYEDELVYFGGSLFLHSYVILNKLGYMDEKGQWLKPKPKYSYLGELIRLNSALILLDNPKKEYYFTGMSKTVTSTGLSDTVLIARIAFVQEKNSAPNGFVGQAKSVVFGYSTPQKKLDLPLIADGKSVLECVGFTANPKGVPELGKNELDKLVEHISSLEK